MFAGSSSEAATRPRLPGNRSGTVATLGGSDGLRYHGGLPGADYQVVAHGRRPCHPEHQVGSDAVLDVDPGVGQAPDAGHDGRQRVRQLPDTVGMANRFVTLKSHRNPFDQALRISGGVFVEVDPEPDAIAAALREEGVAGLFYTFSWFNTGEAPDLPAIIALAHAADVPVIVDAAAQTPLSDNFWHYTEMGADLAIFSGGKSLAGSQNTGLILGRRNLITACRMMGSPRYAIGQPMKVGREDVAGLLAALEHYLNGGVIPGAHFGHRRPDR